MVVGDDAFFIQGRLVHHRTVSLPSTEKWAPPCPDGIVNPPWDGNGTVPEEVCIFFWGR